MDQLIQNGRHVSDQSAVVGRQQTLQAIKLGFKARFRGITASAVREILMLLEKKRRSIFRNSTKTLSHKKADIMQRKEHLRKMLFVF